MFSLELAVEVESSSYCREVLRLRMKEKLLPRGTIECDAVTVHPPPTAVGVGGGFPCPAGHARFIVMSHVVQI